MQVEHAIGLAGAVFFAINGLWVFASARRGRQLCRRFAERCPGQYAELGRPFPHYFHILQRGAYFRFVMQRGFAEIADPHLAQEFSRLRASEFRQMVFLLSGFAVFGLAFLWLRFAAAA
ncbi:MAG: hypothetical protein Q8R92_07925 [Deltaproteobacteria bacterium]|nr:hypothetical protein [Deltaproteobacteria bacterium]